MFVIFFENCNEKPQSFTQTRKNTESSSSKNEPPSKFVLDRNQLKNKPSQSVQSVFLSAFMQIEKYKKIWAK